MPTQNKTFAPVMRERIEKPIATNGPAITLITSQSFSRLEALRFIAVG